MSKLKDKVIIVTGGSGLIGKGIVDKIRAEGATCINAEINAETDADLTNIQCDITNEESVQSAIDTVIARFGKIDGLVNNAYPRTKDWGSRFEDIPYESWKKNVDWQLNTAFLFCQKVLVQMKKQGSGSIVNIGSTYGVVSPDFTVYDGTEMTSPAAYTAIKGGVINFTRYLAAYFGKHGVRANCVSPGGIFDNQNPIFVKNYEHKVPLKAYGQTFRYSRPSSVSPYQTMQPM
jgi:NAD(P)-dependent dehydrogenase (short-subunit alcohol dehydrogenase family)